MISKTPGYVLENSAVTLLHGVKLQSKVTSKQNCELKAKQVHKSAVGHRPSSKSGIYANNTAYIEQIMV